LIKAFVSHQQTEIMADKTVQDVAELMRDIDLCMLTTTTTNGDLASRPMSNNGEVEYDGNSYFFTWENSRMVGDIELDSGVNLTFQSDDKNIFITIAGKAEVTRDKSEMEEHWQDELEAWFEDGLDTEGIAMIIVKAKRIKYWQGEEEGEVVV
jgi:general stress protein 26